MSNIEHFKCNIIPSLNKYIFKAVHISNKYLLTIRSDNNLLQLI
jgi:hypothetical protein